MEKELNHQGKNSREVRDEQTPSLDEKREVASQSHAEQTSTRPRRRIRAYQRIDYWQ